MKRRLDRTEILDLLMQPLKDEGIEIVNEDLIDALAIFFASYVKAAPDKVRDGIVQHFMWRLSTLGIGEFTAGDPEERTVN